MDQELERSLESAIDEFVQGLNFDPSVEDPWGFPDHELPEPPIMMSQKPKDIHSQSIVQGPTTLYPSTPGDLYGPPQGLDGAGGCYSFPTSHIEDSTNVVQYGSSAGYYQDGALSPLSGGYGFTNVQLMPQPFCLADNFDFADLFDDSAYSDAIGLEKGVLSHDQRIVPHMAEPSSLELNLSDRVDAPSWTQRELEPNHDVSFSPASLLAMQSEIAPTKRAISISVTERPVKMVMKDMSPPGCSSFQIDPHKKQNEESMFTMLVHEKGLVNRRCENIDRATLEREDSTIFGISWPETRWFARIRFPAKDRLINLVNVDFDFDFYNDINVSVPIPCTLSKERRAQVPPIVRGRGVDCFFKLHGDVFRPQFDKDDLQYEETTLLWQGLAVYHTIAVVQNDNHMYDDLMGWSEKEARAFSAGMCQWAISRLSSILKDKNRVANLSLIQKYFLWVDLSALN
ncbi:hypothetical protein H2199_009098 [Coniosporium tulheliwenetii]|uniref:Uncharacterized protein n=1 Tax=Coniosporium tulheliwenetii TaxID=3383036 RepID=A0ACC2YFV2_9PEZI|nr:hypothetical protein H2199_009098 [Cladosporium sp. JES 115]